MSEEFFCTSNDVGDFLDFIEKEKIQHLLLGNGFGLSHPDLKECFKWDMHTAFCAEWNKIIPNVSKNCPEADLSQIRLNVLKKILIYYINKMNVVLNKENDENQNLNQLYNKYRNSKTYSCSDFLKKFEKGNVFTVNYDPIMYFEFLKMLKYQKLNFVDGFEGQQFVNPKEIEEKLTQSDVEPKKKKGKIYYLHGSWFIQQKQGDNFLRKLSFSQNTGNFWTIDNLFENDVSPYIILEDRWRVKEALIKSDKNPYLNFCYEQLKKQTGNLLVFGVSFNNDEHILHALNDSKYEEIYITCRDCEARKKIEKKIKELENLKKRIKYIKISDNVIWK